MESVDEEKDAIESHGSGMIKFSNIPLRRLFFSSKFDHLVLIPLSKEKGIAATLYLLYFVVCCCFLLISSMYAVD